jgi:hypothetical protein
MAFPAPRPKKKTHPIAFAAVMAVAAGVVLGGGLWASHRWTNARMRDRQLATIRSEKVAETQALLNAVHDQFPVGLTDERPCDEGRIPDHARVPLLSFSRLRAGDVPSAAEAQLQPTSSSMTSESALDAAIVAVVMTNEATLQPGSYDGWIVVFDRKATPLCRARVVAKAEGGSFVDFKNQLRGAERAAAARLSPKLALEL